jgi:hypothetical protein
MLGDRIFAAMCVDEIGKCIGKAEIGRPNGALRGGSKKPEVRAFVRNEVGRWHPLSTPLLLRSAVAYQFS